MKYIVEVYYLTGGWKPHWVQKEYQDKQEAIEYAKELAEYYLFTRVVQTETSIIWSSGGEIE